MISKQSPSYPDVTVHSDGTLTGKRGTVLRQQVDKQGYLGICRRDGSGQPQRVQTHFLVCEAFHGGRPAGMVARHLNGVNSDNAASNLKWGTSLENHLDSVRHGTVVLKITADQVREIRELARTPGLSQREIGEAYGIAQQHVSAIVRRVTWAWVEDSDEAFESVAA